MNILPTFAAAFGILLLSACNGAAQDDGVETAALSLRVEQVADGLRRPWGLAFLPDGAMLVTERNGGIVRVGADGAKSAVSGGPTGVLQQGQSGITDIAIDPRFADNGFVYIAFMQGDSAANNLALYRARYADGVLHDGRVIFQASRRSGTNHPGGRMVFLPDETLLLFVGLPDPLRANAQDLSNHLGKILRLTRDGAAAADNPFAGRAGARAEIYSYGHRNAMGLARDAETGAVWAHENGPRGGDELNLIRAGANYGWPVVTYGTEYSGAPITEERSRPGMDAPRTQWTPSIAPSGLAVYRGDAFSDLRGDLIVGFLRGQQVRAIDVSGEGEPAQTRLDIGQDVRVRDVRSGPDGFIYLLTDEDNGRLLRVRPAR